MILAAAALVAVGGLLAPTVLAEMFAWFVLPPLHARFLGAIYLFGAVFMVACLLARWQAEVRWAPLLIAVFTGALFVVSLLNAGAFSFGRLADLIWWASYVVYPVIGVALFVVLARTGPPPAAPEDAHGAPRWARAFLLVQGVVVTLLALALFFAPALVAASWPWAVTPFLAQAYSGPLLAYGIGSLLASRSRAWLEIRTIVPGMLAFTGATLVASLLHLGLFSAGEIVDLLWFGAFGIATAVLAAMTAGALRSGSPEPAATA